MREDQAFIIDQAAQINSLAYDPDSQTISSLDATTAKAAVQAISALEREASARRARQAGQAFPNGSYGKDNREVISARETRLAAGLRAVERAYRAALDPGLSLQGRPHEARPETRCPARSHAPRSTSIQFARPFLANRLTAVPCPEICGPARTLGTGKGRHCLLRRAGGQTGSRRNPEGRCRPA